LDITCRLAAMIGIHLLILSEKSFLLTEKENQAGYIQKMKNDAFLNQTRVKKKTNALNGKKKNFQKCFLVKEITCMENAAKIHLAMEEPVKNTHCLESAEQIATYLKK